MQTYYEDEQVSLFVPDGFCGRMCREHFQAERRRERTSALSWRRSQELIAVPYMYLDLTPGHGNLLGDFTWEIRSPWLGERLTLNTGVSPRGARGSSLSQILEDSVPKKYYLTPTACLGILRRARERGKELPLRLKLALEIIGEGSSVAMGGCQSAHEIGLVDALQAGNYNYIDRSQMTPREGLLAAYDADVFLSSANAMTNDGIIVNIDGNSNRVSCIAQGPKRVLFIVGMNKVCSDLDEAMKRARNVAAPVNAQRFDVKTPCKVTGRCSDCKSPDTLCCQFLITRFSRHEGRIHVILVNDTLGY